MKRNNARILCALLAVAMILSALPAFAADAMYPPIVDTPSGKLRGYMDGGTYAFIGIRYAIAERFGAPQPVPAWTGVKDAQIYGPVCPTNKMTAVASDEFVWPHRYWTEDENCQYLNIWTQNPSTEAKKPVMLFLHGGAYTNGSSIEAVAYEGANLSEFGDVVVVTLNHRLNVIGCLDLSAYGEKWANSGNTGMADIEMALRWIQDNIASFGGDPGSVTIFGQSGGSGKVVSLMRMPSAKGLFHKAIAESSGTSSVLYKNESLMITEETLKNLGLDGTQIDKLIKVPYDELLAAADAAVATVRTKVGRNIGWRPLEDNVYLMSDFCDFADDIPFIAGTNFSERSSTIAIGDGRKNEWSDEEITANLKSRYGSAAEQITSEFTRLFPNKKVQDSYFYAPSYRDNVNSALTYKMVHTNAPVYNYLFSYEAQVNGGITPFHCAELSYVFHNVDLPEVRRATGGTPEAYAMQDVVARAWVNFAYTGNPSQDGLEWKSFSEDSNTMVFDIKSESKVLDDKLMVDLMSKRASVSLTPAVSAIVAGYAANVPVQISGDVGGDGARVTLLGKSAPVSDNKAVIKLDASDIREAGASRIYLLSASGAVLAGADISVAALRDDFWKVTAGAGAGGALTLTFNAREVSVKSAAGAVTVNGIAKDITSIVSNDDGTSTAVVSMAAADIPDGAAISVRGVRFTQLFPSYSFTFSVSR